MEADLQLQLGHIRSKKDKVSVLAADLQRAQEENNRLKPKLAAAYKKKDFLEKELYRLQEMERAMGFEVDHNVLRALDNPMESDILTAAEHQEKMEKLLELMNELLIRTVANYTTAHAELEEQERDFGRRVEDAVQARNMLTEELAITQMRVEETMAERIKEYETIQQLEKEVAVADAEIWLTRADSHRISDQLALLSTKPRGPPCRSAQVEKQKMATTKKQIRVETIREEAVSRVERAGNLVQEVSRHYKKQSTESVTISAADEELALEELRTLLPQILGMVTNEQRGEQPHPPPPEEPRPASPSLSRPCDVHEIVRSALRLFDLELE